MDTKYEDTVQCLFFKPSQENVNWDELCQTLNATAYALSKEYIWHRDEFKICQPLITREYDTPSHLESKTCFGDNIEDEWFIAYLVFNLTEVHNGLIVQIEDNDGDFLLIEAADFLPYWANPETTHNRVFIYNNHIHLIPPTLAELKTPLDISDALKLIVDYPGETKASSQVEKAILERIAAYPDRMKEIYHMATVSLPIDVASLLILKPGLVSHLVNSYCNHDVIDEKKCKKPDLDNCIDVSIQFTKFQYAMILHSKPVSSSGHRNTLLQKKKNEIGYKLSFGFQVIVNESKRDKFSSPEFNKYINNLSKNNYFNDNIEGSKDYNQLLEKAQKYYKEMESPFVSYIYENIAQLMSTTEFKELKQSLQQNKHLYLFEEDSDNWLNVSPDEIDDFLNKNYKKQVQSDDLTKPSIVTSGLSKFLSQRSDYEGIEDNVDEPENGDIQFDPDQFITTLKEMLDVVTINESDDDCSDFSDMETQDYNVVERQLDQELASKICLENKNFKDDTRILSNLVSSMKEEGLSGPTSNIFKSIGIKKSQILDSDDDEIN